MMSQLARAADVVMLAIEAIVKQAIVKPLAVGYHEHLGKDPGRSGGFRHRRADRSAAGGRRPACRRSVSGRRGRFGPRRPPCGGGGPPPQAPPPPRRPNRGRKRPSGG